MNGRNSAYATRGVITRFTATLVVTCSHTEDSGDDHKCDICGTTISECADENKDHACDVCGGEVEGEEPEQPEQPTDGEEQSSGCGSSVGGLATVGVAMAAIAVIKKRKKKE